MKKDFLECGRIVGAHGVKGLMKIESWCDSPKILAAQKRVFLAEKDGYKEVSVVSASVSGPIVLMGLCGYLDRETVQGMKNTVLYLSREDIPLKKGAVLLADIIGLQVKHYDSGEVLGIVKDVTDAPRSRIYVIETPDGKEVLLPDVKEFIKEINTDEGVFVTPIPGFFDEI